MIMYIRKVFFTLAVSVISNIHPQKSAYVLKRMNGSQEMVILSAELKMALLDYIDLKSVHNTKFKILVLLFP